jgi:HAD superfamily hydrolase (TIGR01549 family)
MALELLTLPLGAPWQAAAHLRAIRAYRAAQERLRDGGQAGAARAQIDAAAAASGLPVAEVEQLVADWMMRRPLKYLQFCRAAGLDRLLDVLARAGVHMGVLSDYPAEAKLQALGLAGRFAPVLCATDPEIDAFKPNPRGYFRACEIWGVSPPEVLFVGDRADVDAAGAAAAGMPCAIVGRVPPPPAGTAATYTVFSSFERLSRVFDAR